MAFNHKGRPILTAKVGDNCDLFKDILKLYVKKGSTVLDMTYGKGNFWKAVDETDWILIRNDLFGRGAPVNIMCDLGNIPYRSREFDAVVLDPPYAQHKQNVPRKKSLAEPYGLGMYQTREEIYSLYADGIKEANRLLGVGGILIIKCQDQIEASQFHIEHVLFLNLQGFVCEDLFILVQKSIPAMRHTFQFHARKNHSYFIVQRKV